MTTPTPPTLDPDNAVDVIKIAVSGISGAAETFRGTVDSLLEAHQGAVNGTVDGVQTAINGAVDAVNGLVANIQAMLDALKELLPEPPTT